MSPCGSLSNLFCIYCYCNKSFLCVCALSFNFLSSDHPLA